MGRAPDRESSGKKSQWGKRPHRPRARLFFDAGEHDLILGPHHLCANVSGIAPNRRSGLAFEPFEQAVLLARLDDDRQCLEDRLWCGLDGLLERPRRKHVLLYGLCRLMKKLACATRMSGRVGQTATVLNSPSGVPLDIALTVACHAASVSSGVLGTSNGILSTSLRTRLALVRDRMSRAQRRSSDRIT